MWYEELYDITAEGLLAESDSSITAVGRTFALDSVADASTLNLQSPSDRMAWLQSTGTVMLAGAAPIRPAGNSLNMRGSVAVASMAQLSDSENTLLAMALKPLKDRPGTAIDQHALGTLHSHHGQGSRLSAH